MKVYIIVRVPTYTDDLVYVDAVFTTREAAEVWLKDKKPHYHQIFEREVDA
jgi:hypothetical protein